MTDTLFQTGAQNLSIKKEPEVPLVNIKKEEEKDCCFEDDVEYNYYEIYADKQTIKTTIHHEEVSTHSKKDFLESLFTKVSEEHKVKEETLFTDDIKVKEDINLLEEHKYTPLEDKKYSIDIKDNIIETSKNGYFSKSINDGNIDVSCSSENKVHGTQISGDDNFHTSVFDDEHRNHIRHSSISCGNKKNQPVLKKDVELYQCGVCHKMFSKRNLRSHRSRNHKNIKHCKCNECDKVFFQKCSLKVHINSVHKKIKNYECKECHKMFSENGHMNRHINSVHKKIKNYMCNECYKRFPRKSHLQVHMSIHNRIKSYECNECHKIFPRKSHLRVHIGNVHVRNKKFKCKENFKCDKCQKTFSVKSYLKVHDSVVHLGNKYYQCNKCHKMFSWKTSLYRHFTTYCS